MKDGLPTKELSASDGDDEWVKKSKKEMFLSQKIAFKLL